jgi:hypothetical protein
MVIAELTNTLDIYESNFPVSSQTFIGGVQNGLTEVLRRESSHEILVVFLVRR